MGECYTAFFLRAKDREEKFSPLLFPFVHCEQHAMKSTLLFIFPKKNPGGSKSNYFIQRDRGSFSLTLDTNPRFLKITTKGGFRTIKLSALFFFSNFFSLLLSAPSHQARPVFCVTQTAEIFVLVFFLLLLLLRNPFPLSTNSCSSQTHYCTLRNINSIPAGEKRRRRKLPAENTKKEKEKVPDFFSRKMFLLLLPRSNI